MIKEKRGKSQYFYIKFGTFVLKLREATLHAYVIGSGDLHFLAPNI